MRTYLTCDSWRHHGKQYALSQSLDKCPSIVDLTRPNEEFSLEMAPSRRSSRITSLPEHSQSSTDDLSQHSQTQSQYRIQNPIHHFQLQPIQKQKNSQPHKILKNNLPSTVEPPPGYQCETSQVIIEAPIGTKTTSSVTVLNNSSSSSSSTSTPSSAMPNQKKTPMGSLIKNSTIPHPCNLSPSVSQQQIAPLTSNQNLQSTNIPQKPSSGIVAQIRSTPVSGGIIPRSTVSLTSFTNQDRCVTSTLPNHHKRNVNTTTPTSAQNRSTSVMTLGRTTGTGGRRSYCEPPRLPEYNSFTLDYRKLNSEGRQMAMLNQIGSNHSSKSATLGRVPSKVSSEV